MSKSTESLVESALVHCCIEIADEQVGANVDLFLVAACLVDSDGFTEEFDSVHDLASILCVLFRLELCKTIPLVGRGDPVFREVDICDGASLQHQLPYESVCTPIVEVSYVARRILVAILLWRARHCCRRLSAVKRSKSKPV